QLLPARRVGKRANDSFLPALSRLAGQHRAQAIEWSAALRSRTCGPERPEADQTRGRDWTKERSFVLCGNTPLTLGPKQRSAGPSLQGAARHPHISWVSNRAQTRRCSGWRTGPNNQAVEDSAMG